MSTMGLEVSPISPARLHPCVLVMFALFQQRALVSRGAVLGKSMSNENFNVPSKSKSKSRPSPVQYLSNVLSKYPILYIYIFGHCPRYNKFIVQVPSCPVQVLSKSKSKSKSNPNT